MSETDIAIVGMAGIYPQADDVDIFWNNVLSKRDAVTESSDAWLGDGSIFETDSDDFEKIYTRKGGFLGDLTRFDARKFGTMPMAVTGAQPDQFLALKVAHDALVDAGYTPGSFDGSATGVILGHAVHAHRANTNGVQQIWFHAQTRSLLRTLFPDLPQDRIEAAVDLMTSDLPKITPDTMPGLIPNIMTGRICNRLDLMGPNYIIDAACSSSIITVDLAINELLTGHADMMLAGGVNTTTSPLVYSVFCAVNALSRTGEIRPFDRNANGTILGEGAGVVVLKRLDDALKADDKIYAVIKAIGQSSDGKSSGLMAPRLEGEVLAMERAYRNSGLDPATIGLVEAHGTGIPLGDKTEVDALRTIFGEREGPIPTVPVGSVKSMIGHCIPASGSAAIIKTSLALQNKIIPPTLCGEVSGEIGLDSTPFYVSTETRPWVHNASHPRRAAINAFGFGGINAHMILEEPPVGRTADPTAAFSLPVPAAACPDHIFAFGGPDGATVAKAAEAAVAKLDTLSFQDLALDCWDAAAEAGPARLAIVAANGAELAKRVKTAVAKIADPACTSLQTRNGIYYEAAPIDGKVAFLFPGELAQYPDMMKDAALAFPQVREWFDFISSLFEGKRDVRLHDVTFPPPTLVDGEGAKTLETLMHRVDYGSEMVFAADQAVHGLLTSLGVKPHAMLGHSTGENAALVASGQLQLDRAGVGDLIARMNVAFDEVEQSGVVPKGTLLTVAALERDALEEAVQGMENIHFTMDNCPNQAILFGQKEDIDALQEKVVAQGAVCTRLPISWGYHTKYVEPMASKFGALFEDVATQNSDVVLYSCATAEPFPEDTKGAVDTAITQYVSAVRFTDAINRLYDDGHRIFVECGPNAVLTAFVRDILGDRPHLAETADNRRRGMVSHLRHLLARLYTAGVTADAKALMAPEVSADRTRRAEERAAYAKAPAIASELPFWSMGEDRRAELRALVGAGNAPAAAAPRVAEPAMAAAVPAAPAEPVRQPAPQIVRPAQRARPGASNRIAMLDLAREFHVPFALRAYLMQGEPSPEQMAPYLSERERAEGTQVLQHCKIRTGWSDWSLSRLAVKRAAADLFAAQGAARPADGGLEILKYDTGAPYLNVAGAPAISIAHSQGTGVGAAAERRVRIGIDYDKADRLRHPASFMDQVLSDAERGQLPLGRDGDAAMAAWCLKEATAKAIGVGLQGRPQEFAITHLDPATGAAKTAHGAYTLDAQVRRIGDGICAIAYFATA